MLAYSGEVGRTSGYPPDLWEFLPQTGAWYQLADRRRWFRDADSHANGGASMDRAPFPSGRAYAAVVTLRSPASALRVSNGSFAVDVATPAPRLTDRAAVEGVLPSIPNVGDSVVSTTFATRDVSPLLMTQAGNRVRWTRTADNAVVASPRPYTLSSSGDVAHDAEDEELRGSLAAGTQARNRTVAADIHYNFTRGQDGSVNVTGVESRLLDVSMELAHATTEGAKASMLVRAFLPAAPPPASPLICPMPPPPHRAAARRLERFLSAGRPLAPGRCSLRGEHDVGRGRAARGVALQPRAAWPLYFESHYTPRVPPTPPRSAVASPGLAARRRRPRCT